MRRALLAAAFVALLLMAFPDDLRALAAAVGTIWNEVTVP